MTTLSIAEIREHAAKISRVVRLDQVYLVAAEFDAVSAFTESRYLVTTGLRVAGERTSETTLLVSSRHELVARKDGAEPGLSPSWSAVVSYQARFDIETDLESPTDRDYTCFAIDVATDILHPFARELIQSLTARSPFPAFTMGRSKSIWEKDPQDEVSIDGLQIDPAAFG